MRETSHLAETGELKASAQQRFSRRQDVLEPALETALTPGGGDRWSVASRDSHLLEALRHAYDSFGFGAAIDSGEVFPRSRAGPDYRTDQQTGFAACAWPSPDEVGLLRYVKRRLTKNGAPE